MASMEEEEESSSDLLVSTVDPAVLASKRVVFIGALPEEATVTMVRAAMIPFGDIKSVDMPMDYVKGKHRGFAFVEFEDADDAEECIFNMDGADLAGRTIAVSVAQPNQVHKLSSSSSSGGGGAAAFGLGSEAVWNSDEWFQRQMMAGNQQPSAEELAKQKEQEKDAKTLQEA